MAKLYIYSTMSSDNNYSSFVKLPNGLSKEESRLFVAGKANVTNPKTLITPQGMVTIVEEAEFKKFEECPMLKRHIERGFITVLKSKSEVDSVVKNMTAKDKSAQLTGK